MTGPSKYSFIFAKIKAKESRLLSCAQLKSLLACKSLSGFSSQLKGTYYQGLFSSVLSLAASEKAVKEKDIALYQEVMKNLGKKEKEIVFLLLERYELERLKAILRAWFKKDKSFVNFLPQGKICYDLDLNKLLEASRWENFISFLHPSPYASALEKARDEFKQGRNLFFLEQALEKDYFLRCQKAAQHLKGSQKQDFLKLWGLRFDIANINFLVRAKKYYEEEKDILRRYFLDFGWRIKKAQIEQAWAKKEEEALSFLFSQLGAEIPQSFSWQQDLEVLLSYLLFQKAKAALGSYPFGPAPLIAFLILKYLESKTVLALFSACLLGLDKKEIEKLIIC